MGNCFTRKKTTTVFPLPSYQSPRKRQLGKEEEAMEEDLKVEDYDDDDDIVFGAMSSNTKEKIDQILRQVSDQEDHDDNDDIIFANTSMSASSDVKKTKFIGLSPIPEEIRSDEDDEDDDDDIVFGTAQAKPASKVNGEEDNSCMRIQLGPVRISTDASSMSWEIIFTNGKPLAPLPDRIEQILGNHVKNAKQFNREDTAVKRREEILMDRKMRAERRERVRHEVLIRRRYNNQRTLAPATVSVNTGPSSSSSGSSCSTSSCSSPDTIVNNSEARVRRRRLKEIAEATRKLSLRLTGGGKC